MFKPQSQTLFFTVKECNATNLSFTGKAYSYSSKISQLGLNTSEQKQGLCIGYWVFFQVHVIVLLLRLPCLFWMCCESPDHLPTTTPPLVDTSEWVGNNTQISENGEWFFYGKISSPDRRKYLEVLWQPLLTL